MKKSHVLASLTLLATLSVFSISCKKKTEGICHCTFASGKDSDYDLKTLSEQAQKDSCNILSSNAANFGGKCSLK